VTVAGLVLLVWPSIRIAPDTQSTPAGKSRPQSHRPAVLGVLQSLAAGPSTHQQP